MTALAIQRQVVRLSLRHRPWIIFADLCPRKLWHCDTAEIIGPTGRIVGVEYCIAQLQIVSGRCAWCA